MTAQNRFLALLTLILAFGIALSVQSAQAPNPKDLRLIPFPRTVRLGSGKFQVKGGVVMAATERADRIAAGLAPEFRAAGCAPPQIQQKAPRALSAVKHVLALWPKGRAQPLLDALPALPSTSSREAYVLQSTPKYLLIRGASPGGLLHGVQTLRQLIRANLANGAIPALTIADWPALAWRGFQDDITRGPSPTLSTLEREVRLAAFAKMNFFTYYLEHQYAFGKHADIGPQNGSLHPIELTKLVAVAKQYGVDIIGCQQSFGHFGHILKHPAYKALRETGGVLSPVNDDSYKLLDDMYSEQAPLLPCPLFNVCCDETYGLGRGPSKVLAEKIGVGGVYARHMRRIHDLLKQKYGKRMMMWGDIILHHPENLPQIPKDTVMLTWGYSPRASFEDQIIPFAKSGYDFFVCPGVNCWSRILPDFDAAAVNIRNFVRDGVKHGAMGMLNTTWDDDGENFFAPNVHGVFWGAECAWTGSATSIQDFNRRLGGVLFGQPGDAFGRAIELLGKCFRVPGFQALHDRRFWRRDTPKCPVSEQATMKQSRALLALVNPAIGLLEQTKKEAKVNADIVEYFLFGARRIQLIGRRMQEILDAAHDYRRALVDAETDRAASEKALTSAIARVAELRNAHAALAKEYARLWHAENRAYFLDNILKRYEGTLAYYDGIMKRLEAARAEFSKGRALPPPEAVGLRMQELGVRLTRPEHGLPETLKPKAAWAAPGFTKRCGLRIERRGGTEGTPIETVLPATISARPQHAALFAVDPKSGAQRPTLCQIDPLPRDKSAFRLSFLASAPSASAGAAEYMLYFGSGTAPSADLPPGVSVKRLADGRVQVENRRVRLVIGPEGAHIYQWHVRALGGADITQPGNTGWSGFADLGGAHRAARNRVDIVAAGPAMVRVRCTEDTGFEKIFTVFAGVPWTEVNLSAVAGWFWNYDNAANFAPAPGAGGTFLFSDGTTGPVRKLADAQDAQVKRDNTTWSAKYRKTDGLTLALLTPEVRTRHVVGPGAGWGGTGLENSRPTGHFVIFGDVVESDRKQYFGALSAALSLSTRSRIQFYAVQTAP